MRASWLVPSSIVAAVCACSAGACSASATHSTLTGTTSGGGGASSGTQGSGTMAGAGGSGLDIDAGMTTSGTGTSTTLFAYAHTDTTLFQFNPTVTPLVLTQIGDFDCIGGNGQDSSMTDLAVDVAGNLWAVSEHSFYKVTLPATPGPVGCVAQAFTNAPKDDYFYGLTFAPAGTVDPSVETLLAADTAGDLWAIDTTTGTLTQHGSFGVVPANDGHGHTYTNAGKPWELSGDIVFVGTPPVGFATVRDCPDPPSSSGCDTTDTLVELDNTMLGAGTQVAIKSVRGEVVKSSTCNDAANAVYGSMYGIAAYGSNVFGFSHEGFIVTIDNNDGTACLALSTPNDEWAGAAISTQAPVVPPTTM